MRLARRREPLLDPDVQLSPIAEREPSPAPPAQRLRLLDLLEPEQLTEEAPRRGLAAGRRGDLNVVETEDRPIQARFPRPYMNLKKPASSFEVRDL